MNNHITVIYENRDSQIITANEKNGKVSKIRNGSTSPIKYTIFSWFSQYSLSIGDNYWKDIFENASRGSFSKGYKFNGTSLSIKVKNSIKRINILLSNEPNMDEFVQLFENCKKFMVETSGIISTEVDDFFIFSYNEIVEENKGWSGNISARTQIVIINEFVNRMRNQYNLNSEKASNLKNSILMRIYTNTLNSNEISLENFKINYIEGLSFYIDEKNNEGNFHFLEKSTKNSKRKNQVEEIIPEEKHVFKCSKNLSKCGRSEI